MPVTARVSISRVAVPELSSQSVSSDSQPTGSSPESRGSGLMVRRGKRPMPSSSTRLTGVWSSLLVMKSVPVFSMSTGEKATSSSRISPGSRLTFPGSETRVKEEPVINGAPST